MSGSVRYDLGHLQAFVKSLDDKRQVQVGIFGGKSKRNQSGAVTNAELGAIHEFGSFSQKIPARSFLRMPIMTKTGQIVKETAPSARGMVKNNSLVKTLKVLGISCENAVQQAFASRGFGSWKPDAPATAKRKKSDAPLIDTGQLRRAIASRVVKI